MRDLMLKLESYPMERGDILHIPYGDASLQVDGYSPDEVDHHLQQLHLQGFFEAPGGMPMEGIIYSCLTPSGHDFVDSIRDEKAWAATKKGAEQAGGFTLSLLPT